MCSHVVDAKRHLVACLTRHGIFVRVGLGYARTRLRRDIRVGDVNLWIIGHHRLVHAVEGELLSVRAPEEASVDAKLITVHALSVYNLARAVVRELSRRAHGLSAVACGGLSHVELPVLDVSQRACGIAEVRGLCARGHVDGPKCFTRLPVVGHGLVA